MAAYASLLSVMQTINHIQNHPHPPISFDEEQLHSLTQNLTFLQDFLERYSTQEHEQLEGFIADAAYAAEDVIETHIVDQIHAGSTAHAKSPNSVDLYLKLGRVVKDMDLIKNEVMKIDQQKIEAPHHHQLQINSSVSTSSLRVQSITMAEFDDSLMNKVLDKLTGQQCSLQIISIVGMGGIEGILKPIDGRSLEEAGGEYVKELIDRNLILAHENRWNGEAKFCKIHDLLRDLCVREAQKHRFLCILDQHNRYVNDPQGMSMERRICINNDKYSPRVHRSKIFRVMECASLARSLVSVEPTPSFSSKLMRVCRFSRGSFINVDTTKLVFEQVNLRYICIKSSAESFSCSLLWNVQTVEVDASLSIIFPPSFDIWKMPLLRHAKLGGLHLMNPPKGEDTIVLKNLQTLSRVGSFECSEEMVKRIPNVRRLKLGYVMFDFDDVLSNSRLNSFGDLTKLESLNLEVPLGTSYLDDEMFHSIHEEISPMLPHNITFPYSLRKLSLRDTLLEWEELTTKIGPLPHLEILKLKSRACRGEKWETVEGQFCSLKFLQIQLCPGLKYWEMDGSHFPRLEHLILDRLQELEEIPSSIGDIPTLKSIQLVGCSRLAAESARRIKEEQEENGNDELQVLLDKFSSRR